MPVYTMEDKQPLGSVTPIKPGTELRDTAIQVLQYREELDNYFTEMKEFTYLEPDEIFLKLAAWSARASEIRSHIVRSETKRLAAFRTREIDPFLEEIDRQFRMHSRVQSVRQMDAQLAGKVI